MTQKQISPLTANLLKATELLKTHWCGGSTGWFGPKYCLEGALAQALGITLEMIVPKSFSERDQKICHAVMISQERNWSGVLDVDQYGKLKTTEEYQCVRQVIKKRRPGITPFEFNDTNSHEDVLSVMREAVQESMEATVDA